MSDIANLAAALVLAQAEIGRAVKNSVNPHLKNRYADLAAVIDAVKEPLSRQGLGFVQRVTERDAGGIYVETVLIHRSGETLACGQVPIPVAKADAQGFGSAVSYGKRYSLAAALGVPSGDDDGELASRPVLRAVEQPPEPAASLLEAAEAAAKRGLPAYQAYWRALNADDRRAIGAGRHETYKALAVQAPGDAA